MQEDASSDREPDVELESGGIEIIQQAFQFGLVDGISLVIGAELSFK